MGEWVGRLGGKGNRVTCQGVPIRLAADFSKETLQARRDWEEEFKVMKGKDLHSRRLYPAKLSFRMEELPDKVKLMSSLSPSPYYMKC